MFIAETFYSIQGEGELAGVPSFFIRTSGCNLRCRWCDTPYASWKPEGEQHTVESLMQLALETPAKHCVITGGEPMVATGIRELCRGLKRLGFHITIETAGTVPPEDLACDLASISPKLANSTPHPEEIEDEWRLRHEQRRLNFDALRSWIATYPYQLKFVICNPEDILEIEALIASLGVIIPPHKVLLMPEGRDDDLLIRRERSLTKLCLERGYRLCSRWQIRLFGDTRGT